MSTLIFYIFGNLENDAVDSAGSLNGVLNGPITFENSPIVDLGGRRIVFDNSPSSNEAFIALVDTDIVIGKSAVSWSCWFRIDSDNATDPRIIARAKGSATSDHVWMVGIDSGVLRMRFRIRNWEHNDYDVRFNNFIRQELNIFGVWVYDGTDMIMYRDNAMVEKHNW